MNKEIEKIEGLFLKEIEKCIRATLPFKRKMYLDKAEMARFYGESGRYWSNKAGWLEKREVGLH